MYMCKNLRFLGVYSVYISINYGELTWIFEMFDTLIVRVCTVCLILFSFGLPVCMNDLFLSLSICVWYQLLQCTWPIVSHILCVSSNSTYYSANSLCTCIYVYWLCLLISSPFPGEDLYYSCLCGSVLWPFLYTHTHTHPEVRTALLAPTCMCVFESSVSYLEGSTSHMYMYMYLYSWPSVHTLGTMSIAAVASPPQSSQFSQSTLPCTPLTPHTLHRPLGYHRLLVASVVRANQEPLPTIVAITVLKNTRPRTRHSLTSRCVWRRILYSIGRFV